MESKSVSRQTVAALCDRVYPNRPTIAQAREMLVEICTDPSEQIVGELCDKANDLIAAWLRDADYESHCESMESRRTERDYT